MKILALTLVLLLVCLDANATPAQTPPVDDPLLAKFLPADLEAKPPYTKERPTHETEKRIAKLKGRPVLEVIDEADIKSLKLFDYSVDDRFKNKKHLGGPAFIDVLRTGTIIPGGSLHFSSDTYRGAQECAIQTSKGTYIVGVLYSPIAFVILPDGEAYWITFGKDSVKTLVDGTDPLLKKMKEPGKSEKLTGNAAVWPYGGNDKAVEKYKDKDVLSVIGEKNIVSIHVIGNRGNKANGYESLHGTDFIFALRTGRFIAQNAYSFQSRQSETCVVSTTEGDYTVGIFYTPIAFLSLPNGESYWFTFGTEKE